MEPLTYSHDVETAVGNGRLIARVRAGSAEFVFAGPADGYRLLVDGQPLDDTEVTTVVWPGRTRYEVAGRGTVTVTAQPDAALLAVLIEADEAEASEADAASTEWTLELTGQTVAADADGLETARGAFRAWTAGAGRPDSEADDFTSGKITVPLQAGGRAAFLLGAEAVVERFAGDPFEAVGAWAEGYASRGLRLRTPAPDLDRAVEFAKVHLQLGYAWEPDAEGQPGGAGSKMVCDIFRWRDVWSRDFGSGFGPGGIVAGMVPAVLATLDYEAGRYAAHDPAGLKVSDDTSQGGSAESLGWVLTLVWRVFEHTGDRVWLERMRTAFEPWVEQWIARDADDDGLVADVTEWMDHSRFLRLVEGQRTLYSNVLFYAALRRMAHIADALGRPEAAERYAHLAARSKAALHEAFWNDAGYFNNAVQWGVPDTALMLADNAIAVVEQVASRTERLRTLETLRERSWRPFGTVTTDLPMRYVPADNDHNGKVWPWWMAHEAKARFQNGDAEGGLHVVSKIVDTFARPTLPGLCEEYLNPADGTQDDVAGHAFITGSGALLDAVQSGLLGVRVCEPGECHLRLAPSVPRAWGAWSAAVDLVEGTLTLARSPEGYTVTLDGTRVETLDLRVPESVVAADGETVESEREEDGTGESLRFTFRPGGRHTVSIGFSRSCATTGAYALPTLPPPIVVERPLLIDEPGLLADGLPAFVRDAESFFGRMRHVDAREISALHGAGDLLVVVGNEVPFTTKQGASVTDMIEGFLHRGGSLLLLGPRFPRIDFENHFHGGAQMGGHAGMFWWKVWAGGRWGDYAPRDGRVLPRPEHEGTVYWGEGPLFAAWEHGLGLFGFATDCRGVSDTEGGVVDPDLRVEVVYTDWAVRKPWTFTPLAFTEREHQLVNGPRRERYPCAALLRNEESGARIVVVAPAVCSRADLLHPVLSHVAVPA